MARPRLEPEFNFQPSFLQGIQEQVETKDKKIKPTRIPIAATPNKNANVAIKDEKKKQEQEQKQAEKLKKADKELRKQESNTFIAQKGLDNTKKQLDLAQKVANIFDEKADAVGGIDPKLAQNSEFRAAMKWDAADYKEYQKMRSRKAVIEMIRQKPDGYKFNDADKAFFKQVGIVDPNKYLSPLTPEAMAVKKTLMGIGNFARNVMADVGEAGFKEFAGVAASRKREQEAKKEATRAAEKEQELMFGQRKFEEEKSLTTKKLKLDALKFIEDMGIKQEELKTKLADGLVTGKDLLASYNALINQSQTPKEAITAITELKNKLNNSSGKGKAVPADKVGEVKALMSNYKSYEDFMKGVINTPELLDYIGDVSSLALDFYREK